MIYLIITSSINNKVGIVNENHRKVTYINSISKALNLLPAEIKPIIVENNGNRKTFLDDFNCDILYTDNNKLSCAHKGVNELYDIKEVINKYNISDEDTIIKLTGRYFPSNNSFFNLVLSNPDKDALLSFFNVCTLKYMENDCVLGMFAIKCKYLKMFEYLCKESPEVEFATFVRKNLNFMEVEKLHLTCCFADNLRILNV
uniref:Uncharacterized protein n=1 Tax=viral metagenome TaxID=1070528 RepID=A0A6C0AZV5_9ZZZZ